MDVLFNIEKIKQLKALYFRYLDNKDWNGLSGCLSQDATFSYPPQDIHHAGRQAVINNLSTRHAKTLTAHTGSMPEIIINDEQNATGVWFMSDIVITEAAGVKKISKGYGRYHETYVKQDGHWLIKSILLERILFE